MTATVDCSVLVPVLNEERYIESSVTAMRRQRFPGELEFVFADGGSTDRTREILDELAREDPRIRVFDNPGRSVSAGLNVCLSHARGRWALRMDAHTDYPDDYALLGVQRLQRGGTRWVSGPQVPRGHGPVSRTVAAALGAPLGRGGSRKWGEQAGAAGDEFELDTGVFTGVWERATLIEFGGWDERWPRNSDSEMAARFIERGEKLICLPAMGAEYVPRDSIRGLWRQYLGYGEFRALTALRHPTAMRASHLLAPGVVVAAGASIVAPRPLRRAARLGISAYGVSLAAAGLRARGRGESAGTAALLPVVLGTMHFGHGAGQLKAWGKYGPPLRAFALVAGLGGLLSRTEPGAEPVFAPSLRRSDVVDVPA
jgi:succinoglycan biosynthesis protein ExoA